MNNFFRRWIQFLGPHRLDLHLAFRWKREKLSIFRSGILCKLESMHQHSFFIAERRLRRLIEKGKINTPPPSNFHQILTLPHTSQLPLSLFRRLSLSPTRPFCFVPPRHKGYYKELMKRKEIRNKTCLVFHQKRRWLSARHLEMKIISILNIVRFCGSVNCIFESRLSWATSILF